MKALLVCGVLSFLLSSCASGKQPNIPIVYDSAFQRIVDEEGRRILAVTKNADKAHLYTFHLARFKKANVAGGSVGDHTIYISTKLVRSYIAGNHSTLRIVLAHEIAHDVLEHKASANTMADIANAGVVIGKAISYVPGVIGWAGAGLAWTASLGGKATIHLYTRSAELEADRLGIEYWKRLGWECSPWVQMIEYHLERGVEDFHHPAAVLLSQATDLCSSPSERRRIYAKIERIEEKSLQEDRAEDQFDEVKERILITGEATQPEQGATNPAFLGKYPP